MTQKNSISGRSNKAKGKQNPLASDTEQHNTIDRRIASVGNAEPPASQETRSAFDQRNQSMIDISNPGFSHNTTKETFKASALNLTSLWKPNTNQMKPRFQPKTDRSARRSAVPAPLNPNYEDADSTPSMTMQGKHWSIRNTSKYALNHQDTNYGTIEGPMVNRMNVIDSKRSIL